MKAPLLKYWNDLRSSYWFIPSLMAVGAITLSIVTVLIDELVGAAWIRDLDWLFANRPEGARALLSTIAGSMITVAGVSFSITIAAVAYASSQYGPRLLSNFMQDRGNQITLGTFIATFLYCLLVLRTVRSPEEFPAGDAEAAADALSSFVPHISILCALILTLASLGVLIYFIHHIPESIHLPNVVAHIGHQLLAQTEKLYPERVGQEVEARPGPAPSLPEAFIEAAVPIRADGTGYIQAVDGNGLVHIARDHDLILRVEYRPGDFISTGKVLALAWPPDRVDDEVAKQIRRTFAWGRSRTQTQNVLFLIDELVEISARALSPGVNDPFTAINCMDWLGSALRRVAARAIPDPYRYDEDHRLRVITYPVTFEDFASAIFDQLRPYAQKDRNAGLHMMKVIAEVALDLEHEPYRKVLLHHATALKTGCEDVLTQEHERKTLEERYRVIVRLLHDGALPQAVAAEHKWLSGSA